MAALLHGSYLLLGCEDEFPQMPATPNPFNGGLLDMATGSGGQLIALATFDELNYTTVDFSGRTAIEADYDIDPDWWTALDDPQDEQAYLIAYNDDQDKILIVGASDQGLKHGVMDFIKSLDQVTFSNGRSWSPDPRGPSPNNTCNGYGATDCGTGTPTDAACWSSGAWDSATEAKWCPETALNRPDIAVRMGHPSPQSDDGAGATFLGSLFKRSDVTGASCTSALNWMQSVLTKCDPSERDCEEQIMRFDSLVAGNYTHALDESRPLLTVTHAGSKPLECRTNTSISNADLYEKLYDYLAERQVELLPSIYGLETRTGDEPVNGLEDGGISELGQNGEAGLAEGLSVILKPFEVCDTGLTDADGPVYYLAPVPEVGMDSDMSHDPCDYLEAGGSIGWSSTSTTQGPGPHVSLMELGDLLADFPNRGAAPETLELVNIDAGWSKFDVLGNGTDIADDALSPAVSTSSSAESQFMTIKMPISPATGDRLFVVDFDTYAPGLAKDKDELEIIVEFHASSSLPYPRSHESGRYTIAQTGNSNRYPSGNTDNSIHASVVFRAPADAPDVDEAWIEFKADSDMSSGGVWVDNIRVTELDGTLANMDADSVYIEDSSGGYIWPSCYTASGLVSSAVLPPFDMSGAEQWEKGSVRVDSSCASVGDTLYVSYTTRTPAGLTPLGEDLQSYNASPPDVFNSDYWASNLSPDAQLSAYATLLADEPDFVMLSDLGGELRGIGRAPDAYGVSSADTLSTYTCMVDYLVCDSTLVSCTTTATHAPTTSGTGGDLESCWASQVSPSLTEFDACDCSGSLRHLSALDESTSPDLLVSGDMYTQWHNGGRELYQLPYGGFQEQLYTARDKLSSHVTFLSWWHFSAYKANSGSTDPAEIVGHETLYGIAKDLSDAGFNTVGAPGGDPDNLREWSALGGAHGAPNRSARDNPKVVGTAAFLWQGTDSALAESSLIMAQSARYAWQPEWMLLKSWELAMGSAQLQPRPGGVDTSEWTSTAGTVTPSHSTQAWPLWGWRLSGSTINWAGADVAVVDEPGWIYADKSASTTPRTGTGFVLRWYGELPNDDCTVTSAVTYHFDSGATTSTTGSGLAPLGPDNTGEHNIWSMRFDAPVLPTSTAVLVDAVPSIDISCPGEPASFDNPSLYQAMPSIDFPVPWDQVLFDELPTPLANTCGTAATSSCMNQNTFPAL
ncbi:MAG: hypothetical protein ACI9VR_002539 [Cognaticolwellia sp.]|jgi:hypothetical protein